MTLPRALIVDDDPLSLRVLARMLRGKCEFVVAESGVEALELLEADSRFDAFLVDVHMPGAADGVDVYRRVQARGGSPLFVFVSGDPSAEEVMQRAEHARWLQKPFLRGELLRALEPVLKPQTLHS